MTLIDKITQLRDRSLLSLDASHNYYAHTKVVTDVANAGINKLEN